MEPSGSPHEQEKIERLRRAMYSRSLGEKLHDRPRRTLDDIRPVVGEDWHHEEPTVSGTIIAPRTIGLMRSVLWWTLAVAAVFFLVPRHFSDTTSPSAAAPRPRLPATSAFRYQGPRKSYGGEPTQLQIVVTNHNQVALQLADLVITYPKGTRSPTDLSTELATQRISLGTIEAGGRRQGTISAVFAGGSGTEANVAVDLEYRLAGSSAIFVASSNYQTTFSSSPVSVSIEGNIETVSGQPVELTVTVASNTNTPVKDVLLSVGYPFGFAFSSASPQPARAGIWELGDFAPGQKRQIILRGTLKGESGDERVFRITVGTRKSPQEENLTTPLSEAAFTMNVSEAFLGLAVSVNKAGAGAGTGATVSPGDTVNTLVSWQNNLSTGIVDAVIVARLSGIQIDGATVRSADGFFRSSDNAVLWDKTTTGGALANLAAGAKGVVSFSFQVPPSEALKNIRDPSLTITVNASGKRVSETGVPENLQATVSQRVLVASDLRVTAQGLYYANPFGKRWPCRPKPEPRPPTPSFSRSPTPPTR